MFRYRTNDIMSVGTLLYEINDTKCLEKRKYFWCILDSERSDECVDFIMMCVFYFILFLCVCHHLLGQ